jgi:hypothetical protein
MTAVALERATRSEPRTRSEATMCWVKLPRHPGRAHAWPLCGPWPRPHLAAEKLVELRSSVNLVAMPHQPLDRYVAPLADPGLRDVRCAHIAPPLGCLGGAALRLQRREPKGKRHQHWAVLGSRPTEAGRCDRHWLRSQGSLRSGTKKLPRGDHRPHVSASWGDRFLMLTTKNPIRCPDPAAARRCGGRRPVIQC